MEIIEVNPDKIYSFKYSEPNKFKKELDEIPEKLEIPVTDGGSVGTYFKIFDKKYLPKDLHNFFLNSLEEVLKSEQIQDTDIFITDTWLTISKGNGIVHHEIPKMIHHYHANSVLSGVYYVDAPISTNRIGFVRPNPHHGPQVLCQDGKNKHGLDIYGYQDEILFVETGELLIFDSRINHGVPIFDSGTTDTRISLAFNTWCGTIGHSKHLSLVRTVDYEETRS